jgi:SH3-like domain-containing protein
MATSVPLFAIGVLLAFGAGAILVTPGQKAQSVTVESVGPPSAESRLYTALLEQATVKPRPEGASEASPTVERASSVATLGPSVARIDLANDPRAPAPADTVAPQATVGASAVNMRAAANSRSTVIAVLSPGQPVKVGAIVDGWTEVSLPLGETGWVYGKYLMSGSETPSAQTAGPTIVKQLPKVTATTNESSFSTDAGDPWSRLGSSIQGRAGPSNFASRVGPLDAGSRVRIIEVRGAWLHVVTDNGLSAWIKSG